MGNRCCVQGHPVKKEDRREELENQSRTRSDLLGDTGRRPASETVPHLEASAEPNWPPTVKRRQRRRGDDSSHGAWNEDIQESGLVSDDFSMKKCFLFS